MTTELLADACAASEISTREIADAAGVSVMSIYHHFENKDALIAAAVDDIFQRLDAAMCSAAAGTDDPMEALCARASAYVQFAIDHPAAYRYATMDSCEWLTNLSPSCLIGAVSACMDAGRFERSDPAIVSLEIWTAAHGVASLLITQPKLTSGDELSFARRVIRSAVLGHAATSTLPAYARDRRDIATS